MTINRNAVAVCVLLLVTQLTFAQGKKQYYEDVEALLAKAKAVKTWQEHEALGKEFAKLFDTYSNKWEPRYYAAFHMNRAAELNEDVGFRVRTWKAAESYVNMGLELNIDNAEMKFLKAYILTLKGHHLSTGLSKNMDARIRELVNEGRRIQYNNPRGDLVAAYFLYYHQKDYARAKKEATSSIDKFIEFKPANSIAPDWGRDLAEALSAKIK